MERLLLALVLGAVVATVALLLQRRGASSPTESVGEFAAPSHLGRDDFDRPEAPWLVAVFTSATCSTCEEVWAKAQVLESEEVAVQQIEEKADSELHRRYDIRAVPIVAIADGSGDVRASYLGPVSATHLWAGMADLREPGSVPPECGEPRGAVPNSVNKPAE